MVEMGLFPNDKEVNLKLIYSLVSFSNSESDEHGIIIQTIA